LQPTACSELAEGTPAVGKQPENGTSPSGAKENYPDVEQMPVSARVLKIDSTRKSRALVGKHRSRQEEKSMSQPLQLTTIEASKLLGMPTQSLVDLLVKGEIPFHTDGTDRRMRARDVLAYKARRDASRRKILDNLARAEHAEGVYDQIPDDFSPGQ
jgi:excisionase family DNA binding protein